MKVKIELDIDISAKAVLRDGSIELSTIGSMAYANRAVTGTVNGASEKVTRMFEAAFKALVGENQDKVVTVTEAARSEAMAVAARMGEL